MESKDPNDYKANPDFLLATASHLGVTAVLSDQPPPIIKRVERVLQRIYAEVQAGRIEAPESLEGIGAQLAIVQGQPPWIEELLLAYSTGRPLRNREQVDDYSPIDTVQHSLLDECESINRLVWNSCEERIEKARHALSKLDQATVRVANLGGIVDRRALPSGPRVFISYAHEDKRMLNSSNVDFATVASRLGATTYLSREDQSCQPRLGKLFKIVLTSASS